MLDGMNTRVPTRDRIIEAATVLMWRDGYDAVSVDSICEAAKVRKGSFYHAFASKEALLNAAIRRVWDGDRLEIERIYSDDDPVEVKFRSHIEWFGISQRRLRARFGFVPGSFNMALGMGVPLSSLEFMRSARDEHFMAMRKVIQDVLAPGGVSAGVAAWLAEVIIHFIGGVLIDARLTNSLSAFDTLPESVLSLMGLSPLPAIAPQVQVDAPHWLGALSLRPSIDG
jgi:TetR/AcrR family transcriptional repressor of nem operon